MTVNTTDPRPALVVAMIDLDTAPDGFLIIDDHARVDVSHRRRLWTGDFNGTEVIHWREIIDGTDYDTQTDPPPEVIQAVTLAVCSRYDASHAPARVLIPKAKE